MTTNVAVIYGKYNLNRKGELYGLVTGNQLRKLPILKKPIIKLGKQDGDLVVERLYYILFIEGIGRREQELSTLLMEYFDLSEKEIKEAYRDLVSKYEGLDLPLNKMIFEAKPTGLRKFNFKKLAKLRVLKGLTREHLAFELNTLVANIEDYEKGFKKPSISMLERLAKYFNVELNDFLTNDGSSNDFSEETRLAS